MKPKQLANVLIKILGLSVIVQGIPAFGTGVFNLVQLKGAGSPPGYWVYALFSMLLVAIGIFLIIKSRAVTEFLFKDEEE